MNKKRLQAKYITITMRNLILSTNQPGFINHSQTTVSGSQNALSVSVKYYSIFNENGTSDKDDRKQESDIYVNEIKVTAGLPNLRKEYGNGVPILDHSKGIKSLIEIEGEQEKNVLRTNKASSSSALLNFIIETNKVDSRTINIAVIKTISNTKILELAYNLNKLKKSSFTKGHTNETIDGYSKFSFDSATKLLQAGKFKFSSARVMEIPKKNGNIRKLLVTSFRERVIQKAMQMVIEPMYEPHFLEYSHGFRPGKGTHTALKYIDTKFKGVKWLINIEISRCFSKINHKKLIKILERKIKCNKTIALIKSLIKAGHISTKGLATQGDIDTSEESVLSPLMCNVYLHELDTFMNSLIIRYSKGKERRRNREYTKLINSKRAKDLSKVQIKEINKKARLLPSKDMHDSNYVKIHYVRYADNFIVGLISDKQTAEIVYSEIKNFLKEELNLQINKDKSSLTHSSKTIRYLSVDIKETRGINPSKYVKTKRGNITRTTPRIVMNAPIKEILNKLILRGFGQTTRFGNMVPKRVTWIVNMSHKDIISYFNMINRGLLNYYTFATNRSKLAQICKHFLYFSCIYTLMNKYKLGSAKAVIKKFGKTLKCPESGTKFFFTSYSCENQRAKQISSKSKIRFPYYLLMT
jgi:group II intron reverse transcriptase/maturase